MIDLARFPELPAFCRIPQEERRAAWAGRRLRPTKEMAFKVPAERPAKDPGTVALLAERDAEAREDAKRKKAADKEARIIKARRRAQPAAQAAMQETTMIAIKTNSKTAQVAKLRTDRAAAKGPKAAKKASERKKAAKAKARTPAARKPASGASKGIRPGSKLEIVVGLLKRPEGCTAADVLKATEWPAVSMPQQARAAGLTLRQEKDGKVTRYWGS